MSLWLPECAAASGRLKQIEPVDPEGHLIIDFSLFDAWRAGFRDVVFIIKREMEGEFRACIGDTIVSMNLWGFSAHMLDELWGRMPAFLTEAMQKNPLKCEYFLPFVVNEQMADGTASVRVLPCEESWYGVTYREDLASVKAAVAKMKAEGIYTEKLWG